MKKIHIIVVGCLAHQIITKITNLKRDSQWFIQ